MFCFFNSVLKGQKRYLSKVEQNEGKSEMVSEGRKVAKKQYNSRIKNCVRHSRMTLLEIKSVENESEIIQEYKGKVQTD